MKGRIHIPLPAVTEPPSRRQHWDAVYLSRAPTEVSWLRERPGLCLGFIAASGISKRSRIIDVGGDRSDLVDHHWQDGYRRISLLAVSKLAPDHAKARLGPIAGRVNWLVGDITGWRQARRYALWYDRAVLHVPTDGTRRTADRRALTRRLAPAGHLVIAVFAVDGPPRCRGRAVRRYYPETMVHELAPRFQREDAAAEELATPSGRLQKFVYSRFQRIRAS